MILICGLPNAGKTTFSRRFGNVVHYDDWSRLPRNKRLEVFKRAECLEGIFNTKRGRVDAMNGRGGTCIWIDTPADVCRQRGDELVVTAHERMFEPPAYDEGWNVIVKVSNEKMEVMPYDC